METFLTIVIVELNFGKGNYTNIHTQLCRLTKHARSNRLRFRNSLH